MPAKHSDGRWACGVHAAGTDERYWLVKSEPDVFFLDDLRAAPQADHRSRDGVATSPRATFCATA